MSCASVRAAFAPSAVRARRVNRSRAVRVAAKAAVDSAVITVRKPTAEEKATASTWGTWGCDVSEFPWSYGERETCVLVEGEVTVTPEGGEPVTIVAGDLAVFPKGMSCTWKVTKKIRKYFNFG
mmetsp:Transcript_17114/g.55983  ORF Transcript_17114/g.55983 Transcript_17114/m.55983 type:complete len:124 (-) Transcript_17114:859-1230(-)